MIDSVIEGYDVGPLLQVSCDLGRLGVIIVQGQDMPGKFLQPIRIGAGQFHGSAQFGQKHDHVGHGGAPVDAKRPVLIINLTGVTRCAG